MTIDIGVYIRPNRRYRSAHRADGLVPVLRCDPQFAVPCLDGVPYRLPLRVRQSTDLRRKDQVPGAAIAARYARYKIHMRYI